MELLELGPDQEKRQLIHFREPLKFNACRSEKVKIGPLESKWSRGIHGQLLVHFKSHKDMTTISTQVRIIKEGRWDFCVGFLQADRVISDHDHPGNVM